MFPLFVLFFSRVGRKRVTDESEPCKIVEHHGAKSFTNRQGMHVTDKYRLQAVTLYGMTYMT